MGKHLWFKETLPQYCTDCEAACVFAHLPADWQANVNVKATPQETEKVAKILGRKPIPEEADKFAAVKATLAKKGKTVVPPLLHFVDNYLLSCRHCDNARCKAICPQKAIVRDENGVVSVDRDKCIGCRSCLAACTMGIPQFTEDRRAIKCDMCKDFEGKEPACVAAAENNALMYLDMKGIYAPKPQGNEKVGLGLRELWHNKEEKPDYMLRFRGNGGGYWTSEQLDVIADWSDKIVHAPEYEKGYVDITLRQDIELHHFKFESEAQKEEFFSDLEKNDIYLGTFGPLFRSLVSCVGGSCPKSRRDAKDLGFKLYTALNENGFNLPKLKGKIKVGISGCLEGCGHMRMYDITAAAAVKTEVEGDPVDKKFEGKPVYRIFMGGNMGRYPQAGIQIAEFDTDEEFVDFVLKVAEFFKDFCDLGNIHRLSYWIRVKYGKTGDPFIFSEKGVELFLEDMVKWAKKKYGELSWMKKFAIEKDIRPCVAAFRDFHQAKLTTPMNIYEREEIFPHVVVKGDDK